MSIMVPSLCFSSPQVAGRANCLAASGKNIFVGLSTGLAAFSAADCRRVCSWEAAKFEICAIHASDLGNENHVLIALDEMGPCHTGFSESFPEGGIMYHKGMGVTGWGTSIYYIKRAKIGRKYM